MFLMAVDTLFAWKGSSSSGTQTVQSLLFIHFITLVEFLNSFSNTRFFFGFFVVIRVCSVSLSIIVDNFFVFVIPKSAALVLLRYNKQSDGSSEVILLLPTSERYRITTETKTRGTTELLWSVSTTHRLFNVNEEILCPKYGRYEQTETIYRNFCSYRVFVVFF